MTSKQDIQISVVIPIYNTEKYVKDTLITVLAGISSSVEVLCINDGCTDASPDIVKGMIEKYPQHSIRLINQKNEGLSHARNTGINSSQGCYILFVDSDDRLAPDVLKNLLTCINQSIKKPDVITFGYEIISECGEVIKTVKLKNTNPANQLKLTDIPNSMSNVWRYAINRAFLLENKLYFRTNISCEDIDWCTRVFCAEPKLYSVLGSGYQYRKDRKGSIMSVGHTARILDALDNISFSLAWVEQKKEKIINNYTVLLDGLAAQFYYNILQLSSVSKTDRKRIVEKSKHILVSFSNTRGVKNRAIYFIFKVFGIQVGSSMMSGIKKLVSWRQHEK